MADDDVQLTDLEVIQRFSLAVRGATASRADVIAALESDLAYLGGSRRAPASKAAPAASVEKADKPEQAAPTRAQAKPAVKAAVKPAAKAPVKPAAKAPVKPAAKKAPAKTTRARRA